MTTSGRTSQLDEAGGGWLGVAKRAFECFQRDRILLVAAGVTFYALLALVPALAAFISLYGLFFDVQDVEQQISRLSGILPGGAITVVQDQATRIVSQSGGTLGLTFFTGLAVSLWSANAGVKAIIEALNIVHDETEKRSFLVLNAQSLLLTIGGMLFIVIMLAGLTVIPVVLRFVGAESAGAAWISYGRWPVLLIVVMAALAVLYRYGPSREAPDRRFISWGSAVAAIVWLGFSGAFSLYVANFGSFNETYGSLGALIGFMTWIWLSAAIVLAGAELNSVLDQRHEGASGIKRK